LKIAFIGGGNMAEAMLGTLLKRGIDKFAAVTVVEIKAERRQCWEHC